MKKYILWFTSILIIVVGLILCVDRISVKKEDTRKDKKEQTVLTFMLPQTHYKPFLEKLLDKFERENPDILIEPQIIPDNQWIDIVKAKTTVRETPDIIRIDRGLLMEVGTEHFVPMDETESWFYRVIPEQLHNKMVDGKLHGLPISSSTGLGVVYNRRIFEQCHLEIPKTFSEFRKVCQVLKSQGITPLYVSDKDAWTAQVAFNLIAPTVADQQVWDSIKANKVKWNEVPEFEQILQAMADLRKDGYTNKDAMEATYESALEAMAGERAAMYIMGQFFINDVQDIAPDIDLMVFAMPYEKDILTVVDGPGQLSIFKDSPHQEEAKVFLEWFSQPENMDVFTSGWGHMPVFSDQKQKLSECQQVLIDEYITPGKTVQELADIFPGVDLSDFWSYQQEMYAGVLSPKEVLVSWDESYRTQMDNE